LRRRFHPLRAPLLSRVLLSRTRPTSDLAAIGEAPPLGFPFLPHRDVSQWHLARGIPSPGHSVLGVSHALDGLLRLWPCGFVSPHSHVQGSLSRGLCPAPSHGHLVDGQCPLVVGDGTLPTVARRRHVPPPRPQGFLPGADPRSLRWCLAIARTRSPPELSLLQVLSPVAVGAPSRPLRSWSSERVRRVVLSPDLQRVTDAGLG
jgi:hypothetical protein